MEVRNRCFRSEARRVQPASRVRTYSRSLGMLQHA
ncbi:MAG: hypothetical protein ACI8XZ_005614 [Gammaproteobacteria bacterium]|jgi:hypothetical protein